MDRVEVNPEVMGGKPVIRGTRVTVEIILRMLAQRIPEDGILKEYPHLRRDDIAAALLFAADTMADEELLPFKLTA